MTSTLRAKIGGVWVPPSPVADGNLRVKINGAWTPATYCYIKSGGAWRNTGYTGLPSQPSVVWVQQWNYSQTLTGFSGPSGGPPIDYYHIERADANGTPQEGYYDTSGSRWWNTPQDTRHQFRVRSHGVNGLWSDWVSQGAGQRVGIGHDQTPNYGYVERARGWQSSAAINGYGYYGNLAGVYVPNRVLGQAIHWQLACHDYFSPVLSVAVPDFVEGGDRQINIFINGGVWQYNVEWPSPLDGWDWVNWWGNGQATGIYCHGGGWWYAHPDPVRQVDGYVTVHGTEYYDNYEVVSWNPAQGNYYW